MSETIHTKQHIEVSEMKVIKRITRKMKRYRERKENIIQTCKVENIGD